jgi:hypothetical protein
VKIEAPPREVLERWAEKGDGKIELNLSRDDWDNFLMALLRQQGINIQIATLLAKIARHLGEPELRSEILEMGEEAKESADRISQFINAVMSKAEAANHE